MPAYALDDFAFDLRRAVPPADIWVGSGTGTAAPLPGTVCGVGAWFSPPWAVPDGRLTVALDIDGRPVPDAVARGAGDRGLLYSGGTWYPDRIVRHGTYHQYRDGRLASVAVRTTLTPRSGAPGYELTIAVLNRADHRASVSVRPDPAAGGARSVALSQWGWMPPAAGPGAAPVTSVHGPLPAELEPGAEASVTVVVQPPAGSTYTAEQTARWPARLATALAGVPRLETDIPGLADYYRRSLASGLVCLWEHPGFVTSPFPATSGLDGGALCAYAWDTGGYAPQLLAVMLGEGVASLIEALLDAGLTDHYAIAPDGAGVGVAYAYSAWSLVRLAHAAAGQGGIEPGLVARLYDACAGLDSRFPPAGPGGLLRDYGDQHNLLEMRSAGWEHVTASPNAERAWSLEMLAALSQATGAQLPEQAMRDSAAAIRAAVAAQLWDDEAGWFRCRYPDGHTELAYSVQAFDALRAGACPPGGAAALLARLRPGEFLGEYGVSSVSAADERRYELNDTDWSGGGAYTGEAPQLALTLWELGEPALAWDVLRRVLWMGQHFPYFPQEHYCDRPAAPPQGRRANTIAGLAGAEAIVAGLAGVSFLPDGTLLARPQPVAAGTVELRGLAHRGRSIDVTAGPDGCLVTVDGQPAAPCPDGTVRVAAPQDRRAGALLR